MFDSHNFSDDEDVEYILDEYYHDGKAEVMINENYKIYSFLDVNNSNEAKKELDNHNLEYKSVSFSKFVFIITILNKEIINFLDENLLSLKPVLHRDNSIVTYFNNKQGIRSYYYINYRKFKIDYTNIWLPFISKFSSNSNDICIITLWYVKNFINSECVYTYT